MSTSKEDPSLGVLVSEVLNEFKALLHSEVRLAQAELSKKAKKAAVALALLAAGAAFGLATVVMLLFTVASLLADAGVPAGIATLLATLAGAGAAAGLCWAGLRKVRSYSFVPERTVRQLHHDASAAKGHMS